MQVGEPNQSTDNMNFLTKNRILCLLISFHSYHDSIKQTIQELITVIHLEKTSVNLFARWFQSRTGFMSYKYMELRKLDKIFVRLKQKNSLRGSGCSKVG